MEVTIYEQCSLVIFDIQIFLPFSQRRKLARILKFNYRVEIKETKSTRKC